MRPKTFGIRWAVVGMLGGVVATVACGGDGNGPGTIASVQITAPFDTLTAVGETVQLSATALDAAGNAVAGVAFQWTTSDATKITVDASGGLARAVANGEATITAAAVTARGGTGASGTAKLIVKQRVTTVTVTPATASLEPGQTQQFQAAATDAGGAAVPNVTFFWASSDHNVVTINESGLAKAIDVGAVSISALGQGQPGNAQLTVSFGRATRLSFSTQPASAQANVAIASIAVQILDKAGNVVTNATDAVTLVLGKNPWASLDSRGGSLLGTATVNAVAGVATFNNLRIDKPGQGYTLEAALAAGQRGSSALFNVGLTLQTIVAGASSHTCGRDAANNAFCWGWNGNGQLGAVTGNTRSDSVAVLVRNALSFSQVSVGSSHSCGIAAGVAYCWGYNGNGQLGDGTTTQSDVPVQVSSTLSFTRIAAGSSHTCALDTTGKAYCWGWNGSGQLGDGTTTQSLTPVAVSGTLSFATIVAGSSHTCARTSANAAHCWGENFAGGLGDGTTVDKSVPTAVSGGLSFTSLTAGNFHTCGVTAANAGYCWGYNWAGQVGDGTTVNKLAPTVLTGLSFTSIGAGSNHTCGVTTAGGGLCWGYNWAGMVGDGTTVNRPRRWR